MILTVTLNTAIDKHYVVDEYRPGQLNRVRECTYAPGGKGVNVAKAVSFMGEAVVATGFVGGYAGKFLEDALKPFQFSAQFCHLMGETRSSIHIWDEKNQQETELLEPGFTVSEGEYRDFLTRFEQLLKNAQVVVLSGSAPRGIPNDCYKTLVELCKKEERKVLLDTSGILLEKGIEACPTMIKPNIDEIRMLTGKPCDKQGDIFEAAAALYQKGIEIVVISLGPEGCVVACPEGIYRCSVPQVKAVNTVRCGDIMLAGFALGIQGERPIEETIQKAGAMSAAAAKHKDSGIFLLEDMERFLPEVSVIKERSW